ncbi:MAG: hypothetical protein OXH36_01505, partial [Bdellovibrionales bacterium]|nr:hypothetical protein [Bdellovibrionales bacterium]
FMENFFFFFKCLILYTVQCITEQEGVVIPAKAGAGSNCFCEDRHTVTKKAYSRRSTVIPAKPVPVETGSRNLIIIIDQLINLGNSI